MKATIRITQTKVKYYDIDTEGYDHTVNTIEEAIEVEKAGAYEYHEYMDDAEEETFTFEIVE